MQRTSLILRLTLVMELVLIACTWRLWFCTADFPRVPLTELFLPTPAIVMQTATAAFVIALLCATGSRWRQHSGPGRCAALATVVLGSLVVCCNQHCLQPWHWMFLLTMVFFLTLPAGSCIPVLRRLLPCIYIFAAVSRCGPDIDGGMNRQIATALLELAGLRTAALDSQTVSWLCVIGTACEFLTGILLLIPRMQATGMVAAVIMHVALLAALGPFGLSQHVAVVVWNGFLAMLVVLLYAGPPTPEPVNRFPSVIATAWCFVWPALALVGITDNWTGWQLYSPRPEVLHLQIHAAAVEQLPPALASFVTAPAPLDEWCSVRIDRWSLRSTGVPIYPQARFQFAVAAEVSASVSDEDHVRARLNAPASPQWWQRETTDFAGRSEVQQAGRMYWLNSQASTADKVR